MTPELLIRKLQAQREFAIEVAPGKRLTLRRPAEMEVSGLLRCDADGRVTGIAVDLDDVKRAAVGWEGFTEADFVVSGAADAVAFDPALFGALIDDRREWHALCAQALLDKIIEYEGLAGAARGN